MTASATPENYTTLTDVTCSTSSRLSTSGSTNWTDSSWPFADERSLPALVEAAGRRPGNRDGALRSGRRRTSFGSNIAGRRRIPAHLGDRVPAKPENPRRFPPAVPINKNKLPDRRVNPHSEHPQPLPRRIKVRRGFASKVAGFYAAMRRHHAAALWPIIAPPHTDCRETQSPTRCEASRQGSGCWLA